MNSGNDNRNLRTKVHLVPNFSSKLGHFRFWHLDRKWPKNVFSADQNRLDALVISVRGGLAISHQDRKLPEVVFPHSLAPPSWTRPLICKNVLYIMKSGSLATAMPNFRANGRRVWLQSIRQALGEGVIYLLTIFNSRLTSSDPTWPWKCNNCHHCLISNRLKRDMTHFC